MQFTLNSSIIDGRAFAATLKTQLKQQAHKFSTVHGILPGLAILRVGDDPASKVYVASKKKQCKEVGIHAVEHYLPADTPQERVLALIQQLNHEPTIHGFIVQLPLPPHLDRNILLRSIDPLKDVDGLHPENLGLLFYGSPRFIPCTPKGCLALILAIEQDLQGLHAVVVGASNLVGKPMAQLLLQKGCTVTTLHSRSKNPASLAAQADILVVAAGVPGLVTAEWVKPGAIVIDVGINRIADKQLVGDVDFAMVKDKVRAITPVPGGVGPLTVASLLQNTLQAAESNYQRLTL